MRRERIVFGAGSLVVGFAAVIGCASQQKSGTEPGATATGEGTTPSIPLESAPPPEADAAAPRADELKAEPAGKDAVAVARVDAPHAAPKRPEPRKEEPMAPVSAKASSALAQGVQVANTNPSRALELFEAAADEDSAFAAAHYNAGVMYERMGNYDEAERKYKAAAKANPRYFAAIENLANVAVRRGDTEKAEAILLDAIRANPGDLGLRNRLTSVWLAAAKVDAAEMESKKILKADERNVGALLNLATAFFRRGQHELATTVLTRAREINPDEAKVWSNLGFVYLARGKKTEAVEAFKKATELRDDLPEAHNNLGALFVETHDYDAAIRALERAIALYPDFARAHANLGNAYKGNQQYEKALAAYKRAQSLAPDEHAILYDLGVLHLDNQLPGVDPLGRFDIAQDLLAKYLASGATLDGDEKARVEGYIAECQRAKKREEKRIEGEMRRKARETEKKKQDALTPEVPEEKPAGAKDADAPGATTKQDEEPK